MQPRRGIPHSFWCCCAYRVFLLAFCVLGFFGLLFSFGFCSVAFAGADLELQDGPAVANHSAHDSVRCESILYPRHRCVSSGCFKNRTPLGSEGERHCDRWCQPTVPSVIVDTVYSNCVPVFSRCLWALTGDSDERGTHHFSCLQENGVWVLLA